MTNEQKLHPVSRLLRGDAAHRPQYLDEKWRRKRDEFVSRDLLSSGLYVEHLDERGRRVLVHKITGDVYEF